MQDRSHRPNTLATTLTPIQEVLVVELRGTLLLPLDDLLAVTREFLNPAASRSWLDRCLSRHGVCNLKSLVTVAEGEEPAKKTFKDYERGFLQLHSPVRRIAVSPNDMFIDEVNDGESELP